MKKEIQVYKSSESLQISSLISAPIFINSKKNDNSLIIVENQRTKNEQIIYNGPPLNLTYDFPVFSILIGNAQKNNCTNNVISENFLFKAVNKEKRENIRKEILNSIERLKKANIDLDYFNSNENTTINIKSYLIKELIWDRENKEVHYEINRLFLISSMKRLSFELIDLSIFNKLKSKYEKALYLYLETKKFKSQKIISINKRDILNRVTSNIKLNKERNRTLLKALESLKRKNYIINYEFYLSSFEEIKMLKIVKNHNFSLQDLNTKYIQKLAP
tara:strand:+ start:33 stop:860 length:828 start_codon:yes stop_codon:yes gene_type:complete